MPWLNTLHYTLLHKRITIKHIEHCVWVCKVLLEAFSFWLLDAHKSDTAQSAKQIFDKLHCSHAVPVHVLHKRMYPVLTTGFIFMHVVKLLNAKPLYVSIFSIFLIFSFLTTREHVMDGNRLSDVRFIAKLFLVALYLSFYSAVVFVIPLCANVLLFIWIYRDCFSILCCTVRQRKNSILFLSRRTFIDLQNSRNRTILAFVVSGSGAYVDGEIFCFTDYRGYWDKKLFKIIFCIVELASEKTTEKTFEIQMKLKHFVSKKFLKSIQKKFMPLWFSRFQLE